MRRPQLSSESGFTLPELLLTMVIGLIVLGSATMITMGAARHNHEVASRTDATQRGRLAMEHMERLLRSQVCSSASNYSVASAGSKEITFYADLSDGSTPVTRHRLVYDPDAQTITDVAVVGSTGTPQTFTGAEQTRLLGTGVTPLGANPIFRYYAYPDTPPAVGTLQPNIEMVPPTNGSLSGANLGRIARIDLNFMTSGTTTSTANINADMSNSVFVRLSDPNSDTTFNPSCT